MATNLDIIKGAMSYLGILAAGETPTAEDADAALDAYNDMAAQLAAKSIYSGFSEETLASPCWFEAKHYDALKCMLAVNIAPLFGREPPASIIARALTGKQLIAADFTAIENVNHSEGLSVMPSQRLRMWW